MNGACLAFDADTGYLRWFYQGHPNDPEDLDFSCYPVIFDAAAPPMKRGTTRQCVAAGNKDGFYRLDRYTGELFWRVQPDPKRESERCSSFGFQSRFTFVETVRQLDRQIFQRPWWLTPGYLHFVFRHGHIVSSQNQKICILSRGNSAQGLFISGVIASPIRIHPQPFFSVDSLTNSPHSPFIISSRDRLFDIPKRIVGLDPPLRLKHRLNSSVNQALPVSLAVQVTQCRMGYFSPHDGQDYLEVGNLLFRHTQVISVQDHEVR